MGLRVVMIDPATRRPRNYATTQLRNYATKQPRNHATTQPRSHAAKWHPLSVNEERTLGALFATVYRGRVCRFKLVPDLFNDG